MIRGSGRVINGLVTKSSRILLSLEYWIYVFRVVCSE